MNLSNINFLTLVILHKIDLNMSISLVIVKLKQSDAKNNYIYLRIH